MPTSHLSTALAPSRSRVNRNGFAGDVYLPDMGGSVAGSSATVSSALHVLDDVFTGRRSVSGGASSFADAPTQNLADHRFDLTLNDGTRITIASLGSAAETVLSGTAAIFA